MRSPSKNTCFNYLLIMLWHFCRCFQILLGEDASWKDPALQTCWASGSYICRELIISIYQDAPNDQSKPRCPIIMEKLVCLKQAVESSDFQNWTYLQQYKRALCTKFPTKGNKCFLFFEISQMVLRGLLLLASAKSFLLQEHCNNNVAMQHIVIDTLWRGINIFCRLLSEGSLSLP